MPEVTKKPTVVEDDLDDDFLDGALDGFTAAKPAAAVKPAATTKAASSSTSDKSGENDEEDVQLDDEFKNSLATGMEELMKEMNGNAELQKSFEEMFKGLGVDGKTPEAAAAAAAATPAGAAGESFQDRIAKTMGKLKESSDEVDYPQWLEENKGKISESEYARYEKQYGYVKEIVAFFDKPDFDDKSETQSKSIIDLMQGMQDCGQPPSDILDELAPGLEMGEDGTPKMPDMPECNMQ
ncbi:hypothetical protein BG004_000827 [Podila humilis]|nr:hypothetical protein BG004_000827 [Podila humilis]